MLHAAFVEALWEKGQGRYNRPEEDWGGLEGLEDEEVGQETGVPEHEHICILRRWLCKHTM